MGFNFLEAYSAMFPFYCYQGSIVSFGSTFHNLCYERKRQSSVIGLHPGEVKFLGDLYTTSTLCVVVSDFLALVALCDSNVSMTAAFPN